jgi:NAD(P)-dependent dehydrogenase (short-subunit alcohol dehydrogenase family)
MNPSTGRKTLLLTGGSGQLGTAILDLLGDQLDVIALTHASGLSTASQEASVFDLEAGQQKKPFVRTVACDLTSEEQIVKTIQDIVSIGPRIDYVIAAAGDGRFLGPTTDALMLLGDVRRQFDLHVFAPALICSALFHYQWKHLPVEGRTTSVLLISSLAGSELFKKSDQGFYAASKAATNMLVMHMADEYGRYGIAVNALAPNSFPSLVDTRVVASNALSIISRGVTGKLFKID